MKFLVDESVERQIVDQLRQSEYTVRYVAELDPGINDDVVVDLANREDALLVTADKDFGELVFRQQRVTHGVILVRLAGLSNDVKAMLVAEAIREHGAELPGAFTVVTPGTIRIRQQDK